MRGLEAAIREERKRERNILFLGAHDLVSGGVLVLEGALGTGEWTKRGKERRTMNQRRTARARASASGASAMAAKRPGRSDQ